MRVLVTRPLDDASETAALLIARGYGVTTEPMLAVVPVAAPQLDMRGVQAILFTSANGVRAMANANADRETPVYAVGEASAAEATRLGYAHVHAAAGDVDKLAELVVAELDPAAGPLLHIAANVVAGDLQGALAQRGFEVRKAQLYESRAAVALSDELIEALKTGSLDAALFFSPRTAETFVTLAKNAGVDGDLAKLAAYALSPAVAAKLRKAHWRAIRVAPAPEQQALLAVLDADRPADDQPIAAPAAEANGGDSTMTPEKDTEGEARVPVAAEAEAEREAEEAHAEEVEEEAPSGGSGRSATVAILLAVIVALAGYASIPYWRDKVPMPYRSYLPDLPASETRTLIADLEKNVDANRTELARLRAEVKTMGGMIEDVTDAVQPPSGNVVAEIGALKERLAALDARLGSLAVAGGSGGSQPVAGAGDLPHRLDLIAGRVDQLAENVKGVTAKIDQRGIAQRDELEAVSKRVAAVEASRAEAASVLKLNDRITEVESMARAMVSRHDASLANLLAVVQLRAKAQDGQPFDAELRTARALADDKPAFDAKAAPFAAAAPEGVPTVAALRQGYARTATAAARAANAPAGDTLVDKTLARVAGLVTVRRIDGNAETDSVGAVLTRAERLLDGGDVAGAVKELRSIQDPAVAAALKPWLARAEARAQLDAALSTLTADALARVAASAMQQPTQKTGG